jgi:large subunit ribosomal protein L32
MANPKKRNTHAAVGKNRAHQALEKVALNKCTKCGQPKLPHTACSFCGAYKGKEVIKVKSKTATK